MKASLSDLSETMQMLKPLKAFSNSIFKSLKLNISILLYLKFFCNEIPRIVKHLIKAFPFHCSMFYDFSEGKYLKFHSIRFWKLSIIELAEKRDLILFSVSFKQLHEFSCIARKSDKKERRKQYLYWQM